MQWPKFVKATLLGVCLLGSALVLPAAAQLRGDVPGSFLIFPEFNIATPAATQLRISDIQNPSLGGLSFIHLNYICPGGTGTTGTCFESDAHEITTFHGTLVLDVATELGPSPACTHGFIIAFAQDINHVAIASNNLIGSVRISGASAGYGVPPPPTGGGPTFMEDTYAANAWAVQSPKAQGTQLGTFDPVSGEFLLTFGLAAGSDYVAMPGVAYSDFQAVVLPPAVPPAVPLRTELIVLTPTIRSGLVNPSVAIGINWWNQFEDQHSTTSSFVCWREYELETISGNFIAASLGTPYGSMQVKTVTVGTYNPALLGVIRETGVGTPGTTYRKMYHTGLKSSTYFPDPNVAPPGP